MYEHGERSKQIDYSQSVSNAAVVLYKLDATFARGLQLMPMQLF